MPEVRIKYFCSLCRFHDGGVGDVDNDNKDDDDDNDDGGGGSGVEDDRQRHLQAMLEVAAVTFAAAMTVDDSLDGGGSANGIGDNR